MKKCGFVFSILSVLASATLQAGFPIPGLPESSELMHGRVSCQWDAAEEFRRFHFNTNLPTLHVAGGEFDVSLPPESIDCESALFAIADYFSGTGSCEFWLENGGSAAFMCHAGKSELVTIIYDVFELMTSF